MHESKHQTSFNRKKYFGHLIENTERGITAVGIQDITGEQEELKVGLQMRKAWVYIAM